MKNTDHKIFQPYIISVCNPKKRNSCLSRMALLHLRKIDYLIRYVYVDTLTRRTYLWDRADPCGSENSQSVVQLNPDDATIKECTYATIKEIFTNNYQAYC